MIAERERANLVIQLARFFGMQCIHLLVLPQGFSRVGEN